MKRKDFFKAAFFGIAACFLPNISVAGFKNNCSGLKNGGRYPFGMILKKDGETTRALTDSEIAAIKLHHIRIKSISAGEIAELKMKSIAHIFYKNS